MFKYQKYIIPEHNIKLPILRIQTIKRLHVSAPYFLDITFNLNYQKIEISSK